ncbi:hypothetical protein MTsPCn9_16000 [Croceitalea sp. MTPC9]|uniref:alpha/beta fold hydrolase n=1 Tax=unclassified Croceitalea TaxID=2632280 RepID=UPI002B39474F|nr:hypothetical protein MTsPCn6_08850 [Croceitalea sp. MTPC6]GMN16664.1 hypothetical protein MTsPCn9_16000 [Croceitalea sp. MTPC9]
MKQEQSLTLFKTLFSIVLVITLLSCNNTKESKERVPDYAGTVQIDSGYVKSGNATLFYKSIGQGEPIVVLHGGPGGYFNHDYLYLKDLGKNHRMIFFDQRGTGKSECNINESEINIAQFVNDISVLSDSLKLEKFNLLGVSWGGLLSMMYTIENPKRVDKIVLIGTAGLEEAFLADLNKGISERLNQDDFNQFQALEKSITDDNITKIKDKQGKLLYKAYVKDSTILKKFNSNIDVRTAKLQTKVNVMVWKELRDKDFNFYPELTALKNQLLVIHGKYDPIPTKYSQKIVDEMPNARMVLLDSIGHMPHIEVNALTLKMTNEFFNDKTINNIN